MTAKTCINSSDKSGLMEKASIKNMRYFCILVVLVVSQCVAVKANVPNSLRGYTRILDGYISDKAIREKPRSGLRCGNHVVSFIRSEGPILLSDKSGKMYPNYSRLVIDGVSYFQVANFSGFPRGFITPKEDWSKLPSFAWGIDGKTTFRMKNSNSFIACSERVNIN